MQIESYKLYSNYLGWHSTLQWPKSKYSCLQKKIQHTPDPEGLQKKNKKQKNQKKQTKLLNNLQNDQAVYKYISTIVEKLLDRIFARKVMWHEGEIRVLIVIKQIGQTDLMVAKLSWKKFHLSSGIYIHLTHERKILSIK